MRASALVWLLFPGLAHAAGSGEYLVQKQFTLGGTGGWDYLTIDSTGNRLFIARSDRSLTNCDEPTGLAFDTSHRRLFSVCGNGVLVVTDAGSGQHVAEVPIGKGPDAATFDAGRALIFSSNGQDGTLTVIHEDEPDHYTVVGNVTTQKSARTMALDSATHRVYLVAAQFDATPAPSAEVPHPRPSIVDGSFKVLVIGN
jgi:hypothetical protein